MPHEKYEEWHMQLDAPFAFEPEATLPSIPGGGPAMWDDEAEAATWAAAVSGS